jgi:hypothetical protein
VARIGVFQYSGQACLYYTVHAAVGPGAPNRRDDVLLVQYLLRECFKSKKFTAAPFPGGVVGVDGVAGQQTFAAIRHFQSVGKSQGQNMVQDGRVDPPATDTTVSSISQTVYTILNLNSVFRGYRPQDWSRLSQAPDCPAELRVPLREPIWDWKY